MSRKILVIGPLFVLLGTALPPLAARELTVVLKPQSTYSQDAILAMEREASEIYRPSGVTLRWRLSNDLAEGESFQDVVVVTMRGRCDAADIRDMVPASHKVHTLGTTHISDSQVLPFATIECESIR